MALPFVALFIVFAVLSIGKVELGAGHDASLAVMLTALAIILSAGGYGWQMNANDFSRYLPPDASAKQIVGSVAIGGYIPSTLLELLGATLYTIPAVATGGGRAVSGLPHAFAGWFLWPYLLFIIVQLFAINSVDLYSSGLTLQAIIPRIRRWQAVLLDTTVAAAFTAWTVFSSGFNAFITDLLEFMLIWIAPRTLRIGLADGYRQGPLLPRRRRALGGRGRAGGRDGRRRLVPERLPGVDLTLTRATGGADASVFMGRCSEARSTSRSRGGRSETRPRRRSSATRPPWAWAGRAAERRRRVTGPLSG